MMGKVLHSLGTSPKSDPELDPTYPEKPEVELTHNSEKQRCPVHIIINSTVTRKILEMKIWNPPTLDNSYDGPGSDYGKLPRAHTTANRTY
jgi:hypothetical protein